MPSIELVGICCFSYNHVYGYNNSNVDGCIGKIIISEPYAWLSENIMNGFVLNW